MRTVGDVMCGVVDVLRTTESAADAARYLAAHGEDAVPLCLDDGTLAGVVSSRDIVAKVVAKGLDPREVCLADLAEPGSALGLDVNAPLDEAVAVMCGSRRLPLARHRRQPCRGAGDPALGTRRHLVTQRDAARALALPRRPGPTLERRCPGRRLASARMWPPPPGGTWVVDLDGVVWLAGRPIPGVDEAVARLRGAGVRVLFATNNSSPTRAELRRSGWPTAASQRTTPICCARPTWRPVC